MSMNIFGKKINESTIEIGGVDLRDLPDFCDAYFLSAKFEDGTELTEQELEQLQKMYPCELSDLAFESALTNV